MWSTKPGDNPTHRSQSPILPMPTRDSVAKERTASAHGSAAQPTATPSTGSAAFADSERAQAICGEVIGRYTLHSRIAAGGMASVYLGTMTGAADFSRVVAIKRMHPQFASDPNFVGRFRAEAWLSCRLLHPNIVQTFDVVEWGSELLLVMEYIDGVTLRALCSDASNLGQCLPPGVTAGILVPVLHGLHAAHLTTDDEGRPLGIVHRDFSPQNIIIGRDGHAKILDFGIARARTHSPVTAVGQLSGKFGYLAPEQILGGEVDQRTDVFAAGIVLWEALTGQRLFREPGLSEASVITRVLSKTIAAPSQLNPMLPHGLDELVLRALHRDPTQRFESARDMALAIEAGLHIASPSAIGTYLAELSAPRLARLSRSLTRTRRCAAVVSRAQARQSQTLQAASVREQNTVVAPTPMLSSAPPPPPVIERPRRRIRRSTAALWGTVLCLGLGVSALAMVRFPGTRLQSAPSSSVAGIAPNGMTTAKPTLGVATTGMTVANRKPVVSTTPVTVASPTAGHSTSLPLTSPVAPPANGVNAAIVTHDRLALPTVVSKTQVSAPRISTAKRVVPLPAVRHTAAAASKSKCDPPTYMDAEGIRRFKDGCL